jgi:Transposase DDE domain group 1
MIKFKLKQSRSIFLSGQSGLVFVGAALSHFVDLNALDTRFPKSNGIKLSDVLRSYVGLLATGKSDFDAIESRREDEFFARALGVSQVPSSASLRQRLDEVAEPLKGLIDEAPVALLRRAKAPITPLASGHVPVDIDVFPMDNSASRKEGVSRTYAGVDGYAPIAGYLGEEGWCLAMELRPGSQHSAKDAPACVGRVLRRAGQLTAAPLLLRMDSGFDGAQIILSAAQQAIERLQHGGRGIELLIKANPRSLDVLSLHAAKCADPSTAWLTAREGKRFTIWEHVVERCFGGKDTSLRRIYRLTERTIVKGQALLVPELELDVWETSLPAPVEEVIALYCRHGTHEQFHSEIKSDLDLERLPSGKFATNALILSLGALTYNILRLMGQQALLGPQAPIRHPAKRRRIKTVMQELIYLAAKLTRQAGRWVLDFGRYCPAFAVFERTYRCWSAP